ncbi:hypothetical protein GPECTOR_8g325 [Gonium pectorale]|uniref:Protein kinase domain-containing protein n=1 Tax=Gonium pectorale TaxID=33097 RepID=A0A150GT08_GONPE|nr:hypothetical protein GPECTOR_8g325 [Gonium pectorale]|eukprot:KXZ52951.1 hypothetical protein GPECTOR_8g325 [Gonium pectorale]
MKHQSSGDDACSRTGTGTGSRLELSNLTLRLPPPPEYPASGTPASLLAHVFAADPGAQLRLSGVNVEVTSCGELSAFATQLCEPGSWRHTTSLRVLGSVVQYDSGSMPIAAAAIVANASSAEAAAAGGGAPSAELETTSFTCPATYPPPPSWPCTATTAGTAAELRGALDLMASTYRVLLVSLTGSISLDGTAWDAPSVPLGLTVALYGDRSALTTRELPGTTIDLAGQGFMQLGSSGGQQSRLWLYDVMLLGLPPVRGDRFPYARSLECIRCTLVLPDLEVQWRTVNAAGLATAADGAVGPLELPVLFEIPSLPSAERLFRNATLLPYSLYDGPPASPAAAALGSAWPAAVGMSTEEALQIGRTKLAVPSAGFFDAGPAFQARGGREGACWEQNPGSVIFLSATSSTSALGRRVADDSPVAYMMADGISNGCSLRGINAPGGPRVFYDLQGLDYKLILMGRGALTLQNLVLYNLAPAGPTGHEPQQLMPPPPPVEASATTDEASAGHGYGGEDVGDREPIATEGRLIRPPVDRAFGSLPTPPLTAVPRWAQPLVQLAMPLWYFELNRTRSGDPPLLRLRNVTLLVPRAELELTTRLLAAADRLPPRFSGTGLGADGLVGGRRRRRTQSGAEIQMPYSAAPGLYDVLLAYATSSDVEWYSIDSIYFRSTRHFGWEGTDVLVTSTPPPDTPTPPLPAPQELAPRRSRWVVAVAASLSVFGALLVVAAATALVVMSRRRRRSQQAALQARDSAGGCLERMKPGGLPVPGNESLEGGSCDGGSRGGRHGAGATKGGHKIAAAGEGHRASCTGDTETSFFTGSMPLLTGSGMGAMNRSAYAHSKVVIGVAARDDEASSSAFAAGARAGAGTGREEEQLPLQLPPPPLPPPLLGLRAVTVTARAVTTPPAAEAAQPEPQGLDGGIRLAMRDSSMLLKTADIEQAVGAFLRSTTSALTDASQAFGGRSPDGLASAGTGSFSTVSAPFGGRGSTQPRTSASPIASMALAIIRMRAYVTKRRMGLGSVGDGQPGGGSSGSGAGGSPADGRAAGDSGVGDSDIGDRGAGDSGGGGGGREEDVQLGAVLGRGSAGVVYLGMWRGLCVAVKALVVQDGLIGEEGRQRQRAVLEAAISSSLDHPNVVATYAYEVRQLTVRQQEAAEAGGGGPEGDGGSGAVHQLLLVQELCEGGSLRGALASGLVPGIGSGGAAALFSLSLAADVAAGMAHVHAHDIVHGDLSSGNVLLRQRPQQGPDEGMRAPQQPPSDDPAMAAAADAGGPSWRPPLVAKVCDFGLSVRMGEGQTHASNRWQGTPFYMAPELLALGRVSKAADVYSFGVVLLELVCGAPAEAVLAGRGLQPFAHQAGSATAPVLATLADMWR